MAISDNFFSVEKTGYTKVSDLFLDVAYYMLENGFTLANSSHNDPTDQVNLLHKISADVENFDTEIEFTVGDRIYLPGETPNKNGRLLEQPFVVVRKIDPLSGAIVELSDVYAGEDQDWGTAEAPGWWTTPPVTAAAPEAVVGGDVSTSPDDCLIYMAISKSTLDTTTGIRTWPDSSKFVVDPAVPNSTTPGIKFTGTINLLQHDFEYAPLDLSNESMIGAPERFTFTLDASNDVNPNQDDTISQSWRVYFSVDEPQVASAAAATPLQIYYDDLKDKIVMSQITDDTGTTIDVVGVTGAAQPKGFVEPADPYQGFVNRTVRVGTEERTYPLNFRLTITNRGFFLGIWEGNWSTQRAGASESSNYFNWMLVQKPVNRVTGVPLTTGKAPVFHVNSVNYKYWKNVVREADVLHPSPRVAADEHTPDSHMLFNTQNQVALTEDRTYLLTFPHNLTTPRFRYTEEMDMIGITSADVVMAGQWVQFQTYGEWGPRNYIAMPPGGELNTGLRIAVIGADVGPAWNTVNPSWNTDGELLSNDTNNLNGNIYEGDDIAALGFAVSASANPAITPNSFGYRLSGGTLPKGIDFDAGTGAFYGTVQPMDYSQPTIIRFTIDAMHDNSGVDGNTGVNGEMQGFNSKDFYFRYIPGQTRPVPTP